MKFIICQGIAASGKSTWSKDFVEGKLDWVRVNRDDLRLMRGTYWLPEQEGMISDWERSCVVEAFKANKSVVLDATNLHLGNNKKWIALAQEYGAEVEFKKFDIDVEDAIFRDSLRLRPVGAKVIRGMYERYSKLVNPIVEPVTPIEPIAFNSSLPEAIIVDLDGTIAIHDGRNPFAYSRCDTDLVNPAVQRIVQDYLTPGGTKTVLFVSGREDSCRKKTLKWLQDKAGIYTTNLFMRKTGDMRKDCIIKKEIFDNHIKGVYNILFAIDDRPQVLRLWRKLGIQTLDVGDGVEF